MKRPVGWFYWTLLSLLTVSLGMIAFALCKYSTRGLLKLATVGGVLAVASTLLANTLWGLAQARKLEPSLAAEERIRLSSRLRRRLWFPLLGCCLLLLMGLLQSLTMGGVRCAPFPYTLSAADLRVVRSGRHCGQERYRAEQYRDGELLELELSLALGAWRSRYEYVEVKWIDASLTASSGASYPFPFMVVGNIQEPPLPGDYRFKMISDVPIPEAGRGTLQGRVSILFWTKPRLRLFSSSTECHETTSFGVSLPVEIPP